METRTNPFTTGKSYKFIKDCDRNDELYPLSYGNYYTCVSATSNSVSFENSNGEITTFSTGWAEGFFNVDGSLTIANCLHDGAINEDEKAVVMEQEESPSESITEPPSPITIEGDSVNHPPHYTWLKEKCGVEVIDITRHMDFDLGNAVKYLLRAGHKSEQGYTDREKTIEDLEKAIWYINDKLNTLR